MTQNIFAQIRQEKDDFFDQYISIVPGYSFNQYQTLKRIHLYLNSKFEDGSNYMGREKLFFNVVVPACEVATKMLDVDTKDIRLLAQDPKHYFATHLLEKELKQWLKTSKLANVLNQIADQAPRYGSVVLEKTKDGAKVVDLRRLILDPTVENIQDSRFATTIHYMTPTQLRDSGWDNTDIAIERFGDGQTSPMYEDDDGTVNQILSTPYIKVYKRYGEVPKWWIDGGTSEEMVKALFIVAGAEELEKNDQGHVVGDMGVILFKSRWYKDYPFKDFHYNKIIGRWLGLGIVESLFDVQARMNELKNQKRVSMEISSMHLFQGPQSMIRNVLTDLESGDYLPKKPGDQDGITPISTEERNLPAFKDEEESYFQQAQRLSFAYDAVTGEASASSTTATAVINSQQQATSTFGFKRENYTNMLRDFFNDLVLPQLMKNLTPEHIMRYTGTSQELEKLDSLSADLYANDKIKEKILAGATVTPEAQQLLRELAIKEYRKLGDNRFLKIKERFYSDVKFEFDFNIGNEQINPQALAVNTQALLASYNPQAMQDPRFKILYYKYAETLGVSRAEIESAENQASDMVENNPEQLGLPAPTAPTGAKPLPANEQ